MKEKVSKMFYILLICTKDVGKSLSITHIAIIGTNEFC